MKQTNYYIHESDDDSFLSDYDDIEDGYSCRPAVAKDLTPDRIADYLDRRAEYANAHEFVGTHRGLLDLLRRCGLDEHRRGDVMHLLLIEGGIQALDADGR